MRNMLVVLLACLLKSRQNAKKSKKEAIRVSMRQGKPEQAHFGRHIENLPTAAC